MTGALGQSCDARRAGAHHGGRLARRGWVAGATAAVGAAGPNAASAAGAASVQQLCPRRVHPVEEAAGDRHRGAEPPALEYSLTIELSSSILPVILWFNARPNMPKLAPRREPTEEASAAPALAVALAVVFACALAAAAEAPSPSKARYSLRLS